MFDDERTCLNCTNLMLCWGEVSDNGLPERFEYRSGWDSQRFHDHMTGVIGQICGRFQHGNIEINARHIQAERRRREELGISNDWDEENNV